MSTRKKNPAILHPNLSKLNKEVSLALSVNRQVKLFTGKGTIFKALHLEAVSDSLLKISVKSDVKEELKIISHSFTIYPDYINFAFTLHNPPEWLDKEITVEVSLFVDYDEVSFTPPQEPAVVIQPSPKVKHSHYFKDVSHLKVIDVYRVCDLFGVTDSAISHAVKKLLVSGKRGVKGQAQDIQEAIDTLQRKLQMLEEDNHDSEP